MASRLLIVAILLGSSGAALAVSRQVDQAVKLCQSKRATFDKDQWSDGPCISEGRDIKGWVVDIAHSPRQPIDDQAKNQCRNYRNGKIKHFVELDGECNVLRSK